MRTKTKVKASQTQRKESDGHKHPSRAFLRFRRFAQHLREGNFKARSVVVDGWREAFGDRDIPGHLSLRDLAVMVEYELVYTDSLAHSNKLSEKFMQNYEASKLLPGDREAAIKRFVSTSDPLFDFEKSSSLNVRFDGEGSYTSPDTRKRTKTKTKLIQPEESNLMAAKTKTKTKSKSKSSNKTGSRKKVAGKSMSRTMAELIAKQNMLDRDMEKVVKGKFPNMKDGYAAVVRGAMNKEDSPYAKDLTKGKSMSQIVEE